MLDLVQPEIDPIDPIAPKTLPRIKCKVDRTTVTDIASSEDSKMAKFERHMTLNEDEYQKSMASPFPGFPPNHQNIIP